MESGGGKTSEMREATGDLDHAVSCVRRRGGTYIPTPYLLFQWTVNSYK